MRIIKEIMGRVFALWAITTFLITFLIIFIPSMVCWLIPEPKGQDIFIKIARIWMNVWLTIVGCPIKIKGKKNFIPGETYIITCNHNSLMDVPLSCLYFPGQIKPIAKTTFQKTLYFVFFFIKA